MSHHHYNDFINTCERHMYKSYTEDCKNLEAARPELASIFGRWSFLHDVLVWANAKGSPIGAIDFVQQDEFSHDAILHYRLTDQYIVFGVT